MSIQENLETVGPDGPQGGNSAAAEYQKLGQEVVAERDSLDEATRVPEREDYVASGTDIINTIERLKAGEGGADAAMRAASEAYVDEEDNLRLKLMAEILLDTPRAVQTAAALAPLQNKRVQLREKGRDLSEREFPRYEKLRSDAVSFQHDLEDLAIGSHGQLDREDIEGFLGRMAAYADVPADKQESGEDDPWKAEGWIERQLMPTVAAKAAAHGFFQNLEGNKTIEMAKVKDDIGGTDFTVRFASGRELPVKVRRGSADMKLVDGILQFGVLDRAVDGFGLVDGAQGPLQQKMMEELRTSEYWTKRPE